MSTNKRFNRNKVRKHRRSSAISPTERADLNWEMLKEWKNTPKDIRPSWEEHKRRFYKLKRVSVQDNGISV